MKSVLVLMPGDQLAVRSHVTRKHTMLSHGIDSSHDRWIKRTCFLGPRAFFAPRSAEQSLEPEQDVPFSLLT